MGRSREITGLIAWTVTLLAMSAAVAQPYTEKDRARHLLLGTYSLYSQLQLCYQVREGYLAKYINDVELERARTAAKAWEKEAVARDPTLEKDLDKMFAEADASARQKISKMNEAHLRTHCRSILEGFLGESAYKTQRP
jgi:hypothetical protein